MKNILFSLVFVLVTFPAFASDDVVKSEIININGIVIKVTKKYVVKTENIKKDAKILCRVSCSIISPEGIRYETKAGNTFMSCRRARSRCREKLLGLIH